MDLVRHFSSARNTVGIRAGRILFRAGDPGTVMYVLLEGSAAVVIGDEVVEIAGPGAVLGEMALLDEGARSASVLARRDCTLVPIPREQFDLLIAETPAFARHVMRSMAERLRRMNEKRGLKAAA
jgi:CRP/FNR family cyclic AMP-dependent transcriptional regulator